MLDGDEIWSDLPGVEIHPVGLGPDEWILPYPDAAHQGYRLLQEYFSFPDKFLFVDVVGLSRAAFGSGGEADLVVLLSEAAPEPLILSPATLQLGCVPLVNLFQRTSEPIRLDHLSVEYALEPDTRFAATTEVHTLLGVTRSSTRKDAADTVRPFFSELQPYADDSEDELRWLARRQAIANALLPGSEMFLSFVDASFDPLVPADDILFAQMLCTNRGLAAQLPDNAPLTIEMDLPKSRIVTLGKPTEPEYPELSGAMLWRLVSHLSLNKLSLQSGARGLAALQEILLLYSGSDNNRRKKKQVDGIEAMTCRPVVRRIGNDGWRGFVRGTEVTLTFDEDYYIGGGAFLLASVLDRFLPLYAGVNSFTELVIRRRQRDEDWKRWPARAGDRFAL